MAYPEDSSRSPLSQAGNCGHRYAAAYFIAFQVIGTFVFLNLLVAVILENFSSLSNLDPELVSASDIEQFKEQWAKLDPDADQLIRTEDLITLVSGLPPPLGVKDSSGRALATKLCLSLQLRQSDGTYAPLTQKDGEVTYADVLTALVQANFRAKEVSLESEDDQSTAFVYM